ncbi:MAG: hypothetical protein N4A44_04790 [Alphaproteobacteria bacterium]|jgi:hypothetical protein|nr:hypothetical protein [Alphaproteobacteria bacterium]
MGSKFLKLFIILAVIFFNKDVSAFTTDCGSDYVCYTSYYGSTSNSLISGLTATLSNGKCAINAPHKSVNCSYKSTGITVPSDGSSASQNLTCLNQWGSTPGTTVSNLVVYCMKRPACSRSDVSGNYSCSISADEKAENVCVNISGNKCTASGKDFYRDCNYSGEVTCPSTPDGLNAVDIPCSGTPDRTIRLNCRNTFKCPEKQGYNGKVPTSSYGCSYCEDGLKLSYFPHKGFYRCCKQEEDTTVTEGDNCSGYDICPHTPAETGTFPGGSSCFQCVEGASIQTGDAASRGGVPGQDFYCQCVANSTWTPAQNKCVCNSGYVWNSSTKKCDAACTTGSWTNTSNYRINSGACQRQQTRSVCGSEASSQWIAATDSNACCSSGTHWGGSSCVADCVADSNWTLKSEFKIESSSCKQKRTKKTCPSGASGSSSTATEWVNASNPDSCCSSTETWGGSSCVPRITCGGDYIENNGSCYAQCKNLKDNEICFTSGGVVSNFSKHFILDPKVVNSSNPSISECFESGAVKYKPSSNVSSGFDPDLGRRFKVECMPMVSFDDLNEHIPD